MINFLLIIGWRWSWTQSSSPSVSLWCSMICCLFVFPGLEQYSLERSNIYVYISHVLVSLSYCIFFKYVIYRTSGTSYLFTNILFQFKKREKNYERWCYNKYISFLSVLLKIYIYYGYIIKRQLTAIDRVILWRTKRLYLLWPE